MFFDMSTGFPPFLVFASMPGRREDGSVDFDAGKGYIETGIFFIGSVGCPKINTNGGCFMKIVVVGGVAGGASAAARVRRLDAKAQIVMLERGAHVSFSNCCLPYHLSGTIPNSEALVLMTPERFRKQHDIDARTNSEVLAIHRAENMWKSRTY